MRKRREEKLEGKRDVRECKRGSKQEEKSKGKSGDKRGIKVKGKDEI